MKKIFSILPFLSLAFCLNAQTLTWENINLVTLSADNKDLKSDANAFQATALSSQSIPYNNGVQEGEFSFTVKNLYTLLFFI